MYLNTVDFGSNAFGIRTAAKTYFNTTPMQVKTEESAVLVGMLKATTTYNPRLNPKNSKSRRNVVLSNLLRKKFLTHEEYDSLSEPADRTEIYASEAYRRQGTVFPRRACR